jgi:hypothetical protein
MMARNAITRVAFHILGLTDPKTSTRLDPKHSDTNF